MRKFLIIFVSYVIPFFLFAGTNNSQKISVGDQITVRATSHSNTQSVLWTWDPSVMELQGTLYETSTSATFVAKTGTSASGTIIQATTYYYMSGTTSSGINKDVDSWKYIVSGGNSGDSGITDCGVTLSRDYKDLGIDESFTLKAFPKDNSYSGGYSWTSSNPSVATFTQTKGSQINVRAQSVGMTDIKVVLDNGNSASCSVSVTDDESKRQLNYELNEDRQSYTVSHNKNAIYTLENCIIPAVYNGKPVTRIANYGFSNQYFLTSIALPNTIESIGEGAFSGCIGLTSVKLPSSVKEIGMYAFGNCSKLQSVDMSDNIISIPRQLFFRCENLKSINIPYKAESIGDFAFCECKGLKSVSMSDNVKTIGESSFGNCIKLTSMTIPASVDTIYEYAFSGCTSLSSVILDNGPNPIRLEGTIIRDVKDLFIGRPVSRQISDYTWGKNLKSVTFDDDMTEISAQIFSGCKSLVSVHLPKSLKTIQSRCFYECESLKNIEFPNSLEKIDVMAFYKCYGLGNIKLPAAVKEIGDKAFFYAGINNESLTSIHLPSSLEYLGYYAFSGCGEGHLKEIYYNTTSPYNGNGYEFSEKEYEDVTLFIPIGTEKIFNDYLPWRYFYKHEYFQSAVNEIEQDEDIVEIERYDILGNKVGENHKGMVIILLSNGKTKKSFIR